MSLALNRALRTLGWLFIGLGVLVVLYLVYSLLYTNRETAEAQRDLRETWDLQLREGGAEPVRLQPTEEPAASEHGGTRRARQQPTESPALEQPAAPDPVVAVAAIEFRRPGQVEPIVHEDPLFVVNGVTLDALQRGPGHYPGTAMPGKSGNFAVAGHRTTYGAPFYNLDQLRRGDEVLVTAPDGRQYTYKVRSQEIVLPDATWVIGPDPLRRGRPTLTLTTCNPRFSAAQRLIVFAELAA